MNKRPVWRTEDGGVNVGMWVLSARNGRDGNSKLPHL